MKRLLAILFLSAAVCVVGQTATTPPSSQPDANGIYKVGGDISAPKLIHNSSPHYPAEARKNKAQSFVDLLCTVDANGNVFQARVLKPVGFGMDEAALAAAQTSKFKPAVNKATGQAVPVRIVLEVNFVKSWF